MILQNSQASLISLKVNWNHWNYILTLKHCALKHFDYKISVAK